MYNKDIEILDLGCGIDKMPGAVGMDVDKNSHADIIHDLDKFPYPLKDNSIGKIYAKHLIEHLRYPQEFLLELYRVLKPGGTLFIETPHFSSYVSYSEHQHTMHCSYFMLVNLVGHTKFKTLEHKMTFYKTYRNFGIEFLANCNPRNYERFWTYIFPAENIKILLQK